MRRLVSARLLVLFFLVTVERVTGGFEDAFEDGETPFETTSNAGEGGSTTAEGQVATQDGSTADFETETKTVPVRPTRNVAYPPVTYEDGEDSAPYSTLVYDLRVNPHLYACQSTPTLEAFPPLTDPTQEYIIPAVRIGRCNGCNCGNYRTCQPIAQDPVTFQVEVKHYKAKNRRGSVVTTLEEITLYNHTDCRCMCKAQCAPPRVLNPDTCTCVCAQKTTCPRYFVWAPARCACQCNVKQVPCARPKVVDLDTCQCRERTEADGNRAQQKKKPTEVEDVNNPSVARDGVISY